MPINTCICPDCGARINHTVRNVDNVAEVNIICPRCKTKWTIESRVFSPRAIEDARALERFDHIMSDDESFHEALEDDGGDAVEAALNKADVVFENAKRALDDIQLESVSGSIDADDLLGKYPIPDVKTFAFSKARSKIVEKGVERGFTEETVGNAFDAAQDLLTQRFRMVDAYE